MIPMKRETYGVDFERESGESGSAGRDGIVTVRTS